MAKQSDVYVVLMGKDASSKARPLEWYYEPVQNKARILLAARDETGRAFIEGVGHVRPDDYPFTGKGTTLVFVYAVGYADFH